MEYGNKNGIHLYIPRSSWVGTDIHRDVQRSCSHRYPLTQRAGFACWCRGGGCRSLREVCPFGRRRIDAHGSIHELPFPLCQQVFYIPTARNFGYAPQGYGQRVTSTPPGQGRPCLRGSQAKSVYRRDSIMLSHVGLRGWAAGFPVKEKIHGQQIPNKSTEE